MGYAVLILLANVWTYVQDNQINMRFLYMLFAVEEYLALPEKELNSSTGKEFIEVDVNRE